MTSYKTTGTSNTVKHRTTDGYAKDYKCLRAAGNRDIIDVLLIVVFKAGKFLLIGACIAGQPYIIDLLQMFPCKAW